VTAALVLSVLLTAQAAPRASHASSATTAPADDGAVRAYELQDRGARLAVVGAVRGAQAL
jgi:hypothetical protein